LEVSRHHATAFGGLPHRRVGQDSRYTTDKTSARSTSVRSIGTATRWSHLLFESSACWATGYELRHQRFRTARDVTGGTDHAQYVGIFMTSSRLPKAAVQ
jgi:hypothetical protein